MKTSRLILKILSTLLLPLIAGISTYLLTRFLPDSRRVLALSDVSFFFTSLAIVFFIFDENTKFRYCTRVFTILAIIAFINLHFPVFFLYHIPLPLTVFSIIFYLALAVSSCFFIGKQKMTSYIWILITLMAGGFFHYLTLISLCYSHRLYSVFLFAGAGIQLSTLVYYILDEKKYHFRHSKVVSYIFFLLAQLLLASACVLMNYSKLV